MTVLSHHIADEACGTGACSVIIQPVRHAVQERGPRVLDVAQHGCGVVLRLAGQGCEQLVQGVKLVGGLHISSQQLQGAHRVAENARVDVPVAADLGTWGSTAGWLGVWWRSSCRLVLACLGSVKWPASVPMMQAEYAGVAVPESLI